VNGVLILTALRYEASAIAKRLGQADLRVIGPQAVGLRDVTDVAECRGVIMAGLAGALDPSLLIGDVVVDSSSNLEVPAGNWRRGDIHTATQIIATVEQKKRLFAETGALAVDMENATARDFAARLGLPFLGIRAISDRADDPLDPTMLRWVNPAGGLRPTRVAADLCRRPGSIPSLLRLGRRSRVAVEALADAVQQIVSATQP
jgi:nucleoside phosphorylase